MQGRKYETTGNARKGIGDAAWYASLIVFLVVIFIVASVAALLPAGMVDHDAGYLASELGLEESSNGQVTVISYVDADGAVVNAIDMGYATVRRMLDADSRVTEELYFDAAGDPVKRYDLYYGIGYEYGADSVVIRYLGADGKVMRISYGYAQVVRTLDEEGRAADDFYYDEDMQAVQCTSGYYGLHREYDVQGWNSISVFTYLIVQALNGHIDAVNANFLTFNKIYEFLQLNSRKISRENIQINQHPQYSFSGKDIVYAYIPNDFLQDKDIEIEIPTYDDTFMNIMFDLQNVTALLYYEKCLIVESSDGANEENPSEKFIREVCEELSRNEILQEYQYSEILSKAFTYLNLIHLNLTESLPASLKIQMIDDVMMLYNELDTIYERCVDRKS